jgi:3-dehydroquinate synthase
MVGYGIGPLLGDAVLKVHSGESKGKKIAVITHPRLERLYGNEVKESLCKAGFAPLFYKFPEGEKNKTLQQAEKIYDFLIQNKFERSSTLIAFGGGVVGDITGFVAATFLRGISYIQCPTTVVGQVDAAIGGKTGVDHSKGKNLIGAFHQPCLVFVDPEKLATLPKREYVAGLAEIVKYGVIYDPELFSFMERYSDAILNRDKKSMLYCIKRSVEIKAEVVEKDEKELGLRKILNYGHTFGHAVETLTGYKKYKHGEAVAIGMVAAASLAYQLGIVNVELVNRQKALLEVLGLPTRFPVLDSGDLMNLLESDKKVVGGEVHFVLPEKIGSVCVQKIKRNTLVETLKNICLN